MSRRVQWGMPSLLAAATILVASEPAEAQTVLVQVVGADTSEPLAGAVAHLVSPSGAVVASRIADQNGRAFFASIDAGRYRVRAEMLGRSTGESDAFGVVAGGSVPLTMRLASRPIPLAGVEVTAEAGPCEIRPDEEGRLLADIWEEARKALSAAAVTDQQGIYRYALLTYERALDDRAVIVDEQQNRRRGYMRSPFASLAVGELTDEGFVRRTAAEWTYYAPDAQALLSDPFLDTHCFRLIEGGPEQTGLVGLAFEPTGENESVPDISGTLWLERESVELRWLEYTYENLEPDIRPGDATGRVEFRRMPEGTWIVPEWWIRAPVVQVDVGRNDRRRRVLGFRQTGGVVQEVVEAGGRDLAGGVTTGAIEGIVVDSVGLPIQGVEVGSVGSAQTIFTNAEGRFNLVGLLEGTHSVAFGDPALEQLGLRPPRVTREVTAGVSSYVEFLMPSPGELLRASCGAGATSGTGLLGGVVRSADTDAPIQGATVRVRWSRPVVTRAGGGLVGRAEWTQLETTTDGFGVYRFCAVPQREELMLVSSVDDLDGAETTLVLSADDHARMHAIRYAPTRAERDLVVAADMLGPAPANGLHAKSGLIRDAATNLALEHALVELPDLDLRAVSDAEGRVSFQELPTGEHTLRAERLGYQLIEGTLEVPGVQDFLVLLPRLGMPGLEEPGTIVGRVTDENGQGLSDVDIRVVGQPSVRAISSPQGRFRMAQLTPGLMVVRFERLGYVTRTAQFIVQSERTAEVSVVMPTEALELEPITVTVRSQSLERGGFYERRDQGFGHHFDRRGIESIHADNVSDVVRRAPGLRVNDPRTSTPGAPSYAVNRRGATSLTAPPPQFRPPRAPPGDDSCYLSLYIDGTRMSDPDLQQIQAMLVEAIEVYVGGTAPVQYRENPCGVILIWTRR